MILSLKNMRIIAYLHLLTLCIVLTVNCGNAASQITNKLDPNFKTKSQSFKFAVGETITLPCVVDNLGSYVLAWKRRVAILTAGMVKVSPDKRVSLVNGYTLQISNAVEQDGGEYICQIATLVPREITHHVEILIPPKITQVTSGGHLQVRKGSPVRLECIAGIGHPIPSISWTRKNKLLPNGEEKQLSPVLIIENMDSHKGGAYICTANNGIGHPATSEVYLHVLYPPEVTVQNPVVFSGEGQEATLTCIVNGETQPDVTWFKDTIPVDQIERHQTEKIADHYNLIIRRINMFDFGNYSCVANNQLGKSKQTIELTGKPKPGVFRSAAISQWKDKYNISWTVDSYSIIEEYKLYYHLISQNDEHGLNSHFFTDGRNDLTNQDLEHAIPVDPFAYQNNYGNINHWPKTEWRDILLQAYPYSQQYTQGMSYVLRGLDPDSQYEAKLKSRNRFGWSDLSESFIFSTSHQDTEMRDLSVTHYIASSSSHAVFNLNYFVINFIILVVSL